MHLLKSLWVNFKIIKFLKGPVQIRPLEYFFQAPAQFLSDFNETYRIGSISAPVLITTPPHENRNRTPVKVNIETIEPPLELKPILKKVWNKGFLELKKEMIYQSKVG